MTTKTIQELLNSGAYILEDPETGLLHIGHISEESLNKGSFVSFNEEEKLYLSEPDYQLSRKDLSAVVLSLCSEKRVMSSNLVWSHSSSKDYEASFLEAKKAFKLKGLKKVILYKTSKALLEDGHQEFLRKLDYFLKNQNTKNGYLYAFIRPDKKDFLLGLAPEYLFKQNKDKEIQTVAVAGTGLLEESLITNEKLLSEHKLVEEGISKSLKGGVTWSKVEEVEHAHIKHLSSKGFIKDHSEELSKNLHPTAAIGSLPKDFDCDFSVGPEPRGFYGGYAELKTDNLWFSLVLIRGFRIKNNELTLSYGGGVIAESDLKEELSELDLKLNNLRKIWNL